jgi:RND family efflux transporter MFP subunit
VTEPDLQSLKIDRSSTERRGGRRSRGWGLWIFLALLLGGLWLFRAPIQRLVESVSLREVRVTTAIKQSAGAATMVSGAAANGYIVASRRAALSADAPGRVVEMNVTEGSVVKKGDVVARLFADEFRAALKAVDAEIQAQTASIARARAQVDASQAQLPRLDADVRRAQASAAEQTDQLEVAQTRVLLSEGIGTQQALDDARSELIRVEGALAVARAGVDSAKSALTQQAADLEALRAGMREAEARMPVLQANREAAQATLDKTEVRAPFDGIVVLKDAEVGEVVTPNGVGGNARGSVATMVDFATLEVQVELPETNLAAAVVGENATIFLDAYADRPYAGRVERIWPTANRQKATVEVRVRFDAPDQFLRPEMGARIVFGAKPAEQSADAPKSEPVVLVPLSAVVSINGQPHVFVLERDAVRAVAVRLGDEKSGRAVVREGLVGGERLVDSPPPSLADGERVRVASK